jgi:hypothetical protein
VVLVRSIADTIGRGSQHSAIAAEQAHERLAFLADASALLSASLDLDETLLSFADLCVPYLADVCLIDLMGEDGALVERAAQAVDDESLANVRDLRRRRAALGGQGGVYSERSVAESGQAVIHTVLTDEDYRRASSDAEHLEVFRAFGCHSAVVAPLTGRMGVLGVLSLQLNREGRSFGPEALALVEQLASRAALALDNGKLFQSRNRVARSLQAALLPPALPSIAGLGLAARYDVSEAEADVIIGGDLRRDPVAPGSWEWWSATCAAGGPMRALTDWCATRPHGGHREAVPGRCWRTPTRRCSGRSMTAASAPRPTCASTSGSRDRAGSPSRHRAPVIPDPSWFGRTVTPRRSIAPGPFSASSKIRPSPTAPQCSNPAIRWSSTPMASPRRGGATSSSARLGSWHARVLAGEGRGHRQWGGSGRGRLPAKRA